MDGMCKTIHVWMNGREGKMDGWMGQVDGWIDGMVELMDEMDG